MLIIDDITVTADGVDTYHLVKKANRYKYVLLKLYIIFINTIN